MNTLICTPDNLARLVRESETELQTKLDRISERERVALGSMADKPDTMPESAENLGFAMFSLLAPGAITAAPMPRIFSNGGYQEKIQAAALQGAASQIMRCSRCEETFAACFWDFFFKTHAAAFIESAPARMSDLTADERKVLAARSMGESAESVRNTGDDAKAPRATAEHQPQIPARWSRIKALRVDQSGYDMRMGSFAARRYSFHHVEIDREELLRTAREAADDWIPEAVSELPTRDGHSYSQREHTATASTSNGSPHQNEYVRYSVIYVPGGRIKGQLPGPNQPGVIYTIAATTAANDRGAQGGIEIRRPYYWTGHPEGPHIFRGQYLTGYDSGFLTILAANEEGLSMTEAASASLLRRIRDYKVANVYDAAEQEQANRIANAGHGEWVGVPGWREGKQFVQQVESGAPMPAEVANLQLMQETASRNLGMGEAIQGAARRGTTATGDSIAANTTKTRLDYLFSRWSLFLRDCMERIIFDVAHNDEVILRLDEQGRENVIRAQLEPLVGRGILSPSGVEAVVQDVKADPILLVGGDFADPDGNLDWYSLDITIDPTSLEGEYGERSLSRHMAWNEVLGFIGDAMVRQPHVRWAERARQTGRALGMSDAEMAIDIRKAEEVAQVALAAAAPQATTQGSSGAPDTQRATSALRVSGGGAQAPMGVGAGPSM